MAGRISVPTRKKISSGVQKLVSGWKGTGKIVTSRATYRPKTLKEAMQQASAIEYGRARKRGARIPRRRG